MYFVLVLLEWFFSNSTWNILSGLWKVHTWLGSDCVPGYYLKQWKLNWHAKVTPRFHLAGLKWNDLLISAEQVFTWGQLWPSGIVIACICVCVYVCVPQSSVCLDDNLSPAQATITKIGPEVQNTLVKIPIVFGVHWPWPSRSNWT